MPPILPFPHHHLDFLHRLHPRQYLSLGPLPAQPFHPEVPHLQTRQWKLPTCTQPSLPRINIPDLNPLHHLKFRHFRPPINTTNINPQPYPLLPLRDNPAHRYHPAAEFVVSLLRWIFHIFHGEPVRPKPPPDYKMAEEIVVRFWKWVLFVLVALMGMVALMLFLIQVCVAYDRHQSLHGQVGVELARREDAMIRACERKGRKVIERLKVERVERIWREEDKRQAAKDEYLRRQSILQGKLPVLRMMQEEGRKLGKQTIEGVGEGQFPRPEVGRSTSKREDRRRHGTQALSDEEEALPRSTSHRVPRGAEGKIGNSVWRSNSSKALQRRDSEPQVFIKSRTFGLMGVKRNASFKTALQDQVDSIFTPTKLEDPSVTDQLLKKHLPLGRSLSFARGEEFLHVLELAPIYGRSKEILHLDDEVSKDESLEEKAATARHIEKVLRADVEGGDRPPAAGAHLVAWEKSYLNGAGICDLPAHISGQASAASAYHSPDSSSLVSNVSYVATSHSSRHYDEEGPQADQPLLGAHFRSTSTILHTPSPTMHPATAQSSIERLEEGVRSRSSVHTLYDAVLGGRARSRANTGTLHGGMEEGARSRGSADALHDAMVLPWRDSRDMGRAGIRMIEERSEGVRSRGSVDTLHEATMSLPRTRASVDKSLGKVEQGDSSKISGIENEERRKMVMLPRLSFEASGEWSPDEIFDASGRDIEDRAGIQEWEVEEDKNDDGVLRRVSTCAQQ